MGFLKLRGVYRAKARYYPGGPVSTIEYYPAAPGALWYPGEHVFFPLNFLKEESAGTTGELTDSGRRTFNHPRILNPPSGLFHVGTEDDFAGLTPYPGPPGPGDIPPCAMPTSVEMFLDDGETITPIEGYVSHFRYRVTITGIVDHYSGGTVTLTKSVECEGPYGNQWIFNVFGQDGVVLTANTTDPADATGFSLFWTNNGGDLGAHDTMNWDGIVADFWNGYTTTDPPVAIHTGAVFEMGRLTIEPLD